MGNQHIWLGGWSLYGNLKATYFSGAATTGLRTMHEPRCGEDWTGPTFARLNSVAYGYVFETTPTDFKDDNTISY